MIKGLTDNVAPRLPSLGKLRKGGPKGERQPGKDLEYFRFDGAKPEINAAFDAAYGEGPGSLTVYLPFATAAECFETWQEEWSAGGLVHRCDGQVMTIWREGNGFVRGQKPCPYFTGEKQRVKNKQPGCDEVGRLSLILPELIRAGHVGYVTLETHSKNDMLNILGALRAVEDAAGEAHGLLGVPFTLYRKETEISTPLDEGGRATRKKWLVYIEPQARWVQVRLAIAHAEALALPAPTTQVVDGETGEILDAPRPSASTLPEGVRQIVEKHAPQAAAQPQPPPATADAGAPDGAGSNKPGAGMWQTWNMLIVEAKALGLQVNEMPQTVTAVQLAESGKTLRGRIGAAKAQQKPRTNSQKAAEQAQQAANGGKRQPTREELFARVKELGQEAIALNVVGLAWTANPRWTEAELLATGKDLLQRIQTRKAELAQKETAHASA